MTLPKVTKFNLFHFKSSLGRQILNTFSVIVVFAGSWSWAGPYDDYYKQLKQISPNDEQAKQKAFFNTVQKPKLKFFEESVKRGHEEALSSQSTARDDDEDSGSEDEKSATSSKPSGSSRPSRSGPSSFSTAGGNVESGNATDAIVYGSSSKKKTSGAKKTKRRGY